MKTFNVSFERKAKYLEKGYITIEAEDAKEAKFAAIEILESGDDVADHDGDVTDLDFWAETPLIEDETEVNITDVECDSSDDEDYEEDNY